MLTDARSLKELCEFRLAEGVTLSNAYEIEDVASRTGSDALARLCERLRYFFSLCFCYSKLFHVIQSFSLWLLLKKFDKH